MSKMNIASELLFTVDMFGKPNDLGHTPYGSRRFVQVAGGSFSGPSLSGEVLPVGADIALIRDDGVFEPHVNMVLRTVNSELIHMSYQGRFHGPVEVMRKLIAREPGVTRDQYYLWNAVFFETSAPSLLWLNGILAVSTGMPQPITEQGIGMRYDVYRLL